MEKVDVSKLFSFYGGKKGIIVSPGENGIGEFYKTLYELGYRYSIIDGKRIFYQKTERGPDSCSLSDIKGVLLEVFRKGELSNLPQNVTRDDLINWYYEKEPIKYNGFFKYYLVEELHPVAEHTLKLQIDPDYKHDYWKSELLLKFNEWGFMNTIDRVSSFGTNNPLYYKSIGENRYLVFNHYNSTSKKHNDGFDCRVAEFEKDNEIGKKLPKSIEKIKLTFNLESDYGLIKKYVE